MRRISGVISGSLLLWLSIQPVQATVPVPASWQLLETLPEGGRSYMDTRSLKSIRHLGVQRIKVYNVYDKPVDMGNERAYQLEVVDFVMKCQQRQMAEYRKNYYQGQRADSKQWLAVVDNASSMSESGFGYYLDNLEFFQIEPRDNSSSGRLFNFACKFR